jgi:hypothetical protein
MKRLIAVTVLNPLCNRPSGRSDGHSPCVITSRMPNGAWIMGTQTTQLKTSFASEQAESLSKSELAANSPKLMAIARISKPRAAKRRLRFLG